MKLQRGTAGIGYALVVGLIAVLAIVSITYLGSSTKQLFLSVGNRLGGASNQTAVSGPAAPAPTIYASCLARLNAGLTASGVATIDPDGNGPVAAFDAYCEQSSNGGGWTVFQQHSDSALSFEQPYATYQAGFGAAGSNHWLGLDRLAALTASGGQMRVELTDPNDQTAYAQYGSFSVGNASTGYLLNLSGYVKSPAGDSMATNQGQMFSTQDVDQDSNGTLSCAVLYHGGWWYNNCHTSNLNGLIANSTTYGVTTNWRTWRGLYTPLKTRMMFRESGALEPAITNNPPTWVSNNSTVTGLQAGVPFSFQLQASDPENDSLTYSIDLDYPTSAVCPCTRWVNLTPSGLLTGTPTSGPYRIRVGVSDNQGNYVQVSFTGTVP